MTHKDKTSSQGPATASVHSESIGLAAVMVVAAGTLVLKVGLVMSLLQNLSAGVAGTL